MTGEIRVVEPSGDDVSVIAMAVGAPARTVVATRCVAFDAPLSV
jgi:hypothetical protein